MIVGIDDRIAVPESGHAVVQIRDRLMVDLLPRVELHGV